MGIISDVKCGRCDRRYSGLRSRCPYCGARRGKRGKHADDSDNSKAKILIGSLLILVLIVAVVVLIITSAKGRSEGDVPNDQNTPAQGDEPLVNGGDAGTNPDNTGDDGNDAGGTDGSQEPGAGDDGNTGGGTDATVTVVPITRRETAIKMTAQTKMMIKTMMMTLTNRLQAAL